MRMRTRKLVASVAVIAGLTGGALATTVPAVINGSTATAGQPTRIPTKFPQPIPWPTPSTFPSPIAGQAPVILLP